MVQPIVWIILAVFSLPNILLISASNTPTKVIEAARISSKIWSKGSEAKSTELVSFAFSLVGEKQDELDAKMYSIALNRESWLSVDELKYYVAPSKSATSLLEAFLESHGVTEAEYEYNNMGNVLTVVTDASKVGNMFNTTLNSYTNAENGKTYIKTSKIQLSNVISNHIVHVQGLTDFMTPRHRFREMDATKGFQKSSENKLVIRESIVRPIPHYHESIKPRHKTTHRHTTTSTSKKLTSMKTSSTPKLISIKSSSTKSTTAKSTSTKSTSTKSTSTKTTSTKSTSTKSTSTKSTSTKSTSTTSSKTKSTSTTSSTTVTTVTQTSTSTSSPSSTIIPSMANCTNTNVTFACMSAFYGYGDYQEQVGKGVESVAAINYGNQYDESIIYFEEVYQLEAQNYLPDKLYLGDDNGAWDNVTDTESNGEAVLDAEMLIATAYPLDIQSLSSDLDFVGNVQALINMTDDSRPGIVSISYGYDENDATLSYFNDFCYAVQQLAALGTTFVTASGDNGVSVNNEEGSQCPPFRVDFMSACPYVLSIGATTGFFPERAGYEPTKPDVHNGWSAGGFSNYAPTPDWQLSHVETYLNTINYTYSEYYNTSGRGFPDMAAFGQYIDVGYVLDGEGAIAFGGGTSASSPIVSGILGLVNAKCKEVGKSRIGWPHPILYSHPEATNDITIGGSYLCEDDDFDSPLGFPCESGWDPSTGLGSPNFAGLVSAFGCD